MICLALQSPYCGECPRPPRLGSSSDAEPGRGEKLLKHNLDVESVETIQTRRRALLGDREARHRLITWHDRHAKTLAETVELKEIRRSTGANKDTGDGKVAGAKHLLGSLERATEMEEAMKMTYGIRSVGQFLAGCEKQQYMAHCWDRVGGFALFDQVSFTSGLHWQQRLDFVQSRRSLCLVLFMGGSCPQIGRRQ